VSFCRLLRWLLAKQKPSPSTIDATTNSSSPPPTAEIVT
jgi:hypothetical protein